MSLGTQPFAKAPLGGSGLGGDQSGIRLRIGAVDATTMLQADSYRLLEDLNARDEMECTLIVSTGYIPLIGEQITLSLNGGRLFGGTVHEREITFLSAAESVHTVIRIRAVDWNELADRRIVVEIFENVSAGTIVRAIIEKYLAEEGVTVGDVQEGPLVSRMVCPYISAAAAFNDLSEQSGFHWNMDEFKVFNFTERSTAPAPFTLTTANAMFRTIRGQRTRNQYRNVQYVDGGHGITDVRTEAFRGNNIDRTFNVEYPVYAAPTLTRNFQPQTVGIRGVDDQKDWYWNKGETAIGQSPDGAVLLDTDRLEVTYQGLFNVIEIVEDTAGILDRQSVQGGSGRYEQLERDDNLDGQALVEEKGLSLLRRYASLDEVLEFETDVPGLALGQLLQVDVPEWGLLDAFLIMQMETISLVQSTRRFRVTATTGEVKGRYQDFFAKLLSDSRPVMLRADEILQEVLAMHDPVGVTDSIDATLADFAIGEWGTGEAGTAEFGN